MAHILIPTPACDYDPSEVAVSWRVLTSSGHQVSFATPDGRPGRADDIMLTGRGLDPWSAVPGLGRLTVLGRLLGADRRARAAHQAMIESREFRSPMRWSDALASDFDGLLLPGGHRRRGMTDYLESPTLQALVLDAFKRPMPVAAICHGVLLLARTVDPATGRSVLFGRQTTSLTWKLEQSGARIGRVGRFWDPQYYRTYPDPPSSEAGSMSVESEVRRALASPGDYRDVPPSDPQAALKTRGIARDTSEDPRPAFVVEDGLYISARWPGDAHTFAQTFSDLLVTRAAGGTAADETAKASTHAPQSISPDAAAG